MVTINKITDYWMSLGLLISVPDDLVENVVRQLEQKAKNVKEGNDIRDSMEDFEDFVNKVLDLELKENYEK